MSVYLHSIEDKGFEVKLLAVSLGYKKSKLITMEIKYPRFIHSELKTHRVLSTNSASSRAIPIQKMIDQVRTNPAGPIAFRKNQPGMVAGEDFAFDRQAELRYMWETSAVKAAYEAEQFMHSGVHKEVSNRITEPFMWMSTVVTATEWSNFFKLRCAKDAQPEFQHLANMMKIVHKEAVDNICATFQPKNGLHLPYITDEELAALPTLHLMILSVARCAVVSYMKHEGGQMDLVKASEIFLRLVGDGTTSIHASPFEHVARLFTFEEKAMIQQLQEVAEWGMHSEPTKYLSKYLDNRLEFRGNIKGWASLRWDLESQGKDGALLTVLKHLASDIINGKKTERSN